MALKKRTRTRLYHYTVYAVLVAVAIWVVVATDWQTVGKQFANPEVAMQMLPGIITIGLKNTLLFTIASFSGGLVLAVVLALMKLSSIPPFRWIATVWIEFFRGIPALMTIFAFGLMLPIAMKGMKIPGGPVGAATLALIVVASAYMAETIRAGIQAVPKGQTEAARSLGMSPMRTMFFIVLPQGFRIIIPPLTNEFVLLLKDTSLFFVIGATPLTYELTTYARNGLSMYANATPMVMAALLYLIVTIPLTRLTARLERRLARER
ncbi:amino acid ABC transporter permease [Microbacterium sp. KUDC0406]|uniref:amino acid ABC transporter permease n=1 Tax=Microbacterium sp. KUDC0406 TaxID=2909588 RepID=UPI001F395494|nr:amino acid ABC transporter permease [Microbacterium sp. KUDC0406]UJP08999.1 amino acid ABC transporter permease [Microbacterium sp. KUDC0406]